MNLCKAGFMATVSSGAQMAHDMRASFVAVAFGALDS